MDPLRAGHVAIMGGAFLYYCNAGCKQVHSSLRQPASTLSPDEIMTADPPQVIVVESGPRSRTPPPMTVALARSEHPPSPRNGRASHGANGTNGKHSSTNGANGAPRSFPAPAPEPSSQTRPRNAMTNEAEAPPVEPARSVPGVRAYEAPPEVRQSEEREEREERVPRDAPHTLRSAPVALEPLTPKARAISATTERNILREARQPEAGRAGGAVLRVVYVIGIAAGVLVPCLGLLGSVANAARLPLAIVATLAFVARFAFKKRDPSDPHPVVVMAPVVGATGAAIWARVAHDPLGLRITILAGVAAAAALGVELLVGRAKAPLALARERIARELDVRVRVLHGDEPVSVHADEVKPGEQVLIEAGDVVGVDAVVTAGEATVVPWLDAPVDMTKREGDAVVAGARVLSGRIRVLTTWAGLDRAWPKLTLSPLLRIDVAAPSARGARLAVERGTPICAALVGFAAFAYNFSPVGVFAAACAAATAIACNGVASIIGLHHARAHLAALASGIVFKDAKSFDRAGDTDVALFCARGTLLMGEPEIVTIEPVGSVEVGQILALAAGAEQVSTHPFASAILRAARTRGERPDNVRNAANHAGLGVTALAASGERLVVGSRALMLKERISVALADARINELEAQGRSVLLVALADRLVGVLALQDGLRAGARAAVQRLLDARVEPALLSGEARETCETIGRALDIEHIRPEVLPSDRGAEVRALGEGGHVVGVIGKPATDDGALGAADVAVAVGAAGATPGEWAIALASDDVRDAAAALTLPHRTRERVRVALAIGFAPGGLALLAVAFGVAPLAAAPVAALVGAIAALVHANKEP